MLIPRSATETAPPFGSLLRRHRRAAGLTQDELAERAHLSQRTISDLERGVPHRPRPDTLALLAEALALTPAERVAFMAAAQGFGPARPARLPAPLTEQRAALPLVGRAREVALLERHLTGDGPPLLLLAGEPGIGKSRLLGEALQRAAEGGWQVLAGGCSRHGGQEPYMPLLEALERYLQRRDSVHAHTDLRGCAWLVRLLPELAQGPIEPLPDWVLTPAQERRLMVKAVGRFLSNVAGPRGTLLVLDDLQWAGADALDLLVTLARSAADLPLRVIGAYRDTEAQVQVQETLLPTLADLVREGLLIQHTLAPLAPAEAMRLLAALLHGTDVPALTQRAQVLERAGGVPFFLVSYAERLRQADLAAGGETRVGVWDEVPWDVAQSIRQRIAALSPLVREVLGMAAVVGRLVPRAVLVSTLDRPAEEVLVALEATCSARLLVEADAHTYAFAHDVIREVVEADLGAARRAVLHRRVAVALERMPGAFPVEALAYHYARSDDRAKAVAYLEQAGDKARAQVAHAAAADYYQSLVTCLDELSRPLESAAARERLGQVLATMAHYDAALEAYSRAAEAFRAAGDLERLARVSAAMGDVYSRQTKPHEGLLLLAPLLAQVEEQGQTQGLAVLYATIARLYVDEGRWEEALAVGQRSSTLARSVGDDRLWASATLWRGIALHKLGRVEEALRAVEEVLSPAEAAGDLRTLCFALMHISCQYEDWGELETSRHYGDRATAVAERSGDPVLRTLMTTRRGMTAFYLGDWRQARAHFENAMDLDRQVGLSEISGALLHDLGRLELAEGDWAAATRCLEQSLSIVERSRDPYFVRDVQRSLAERDLLMGQAAAAQARVQPLLDQAGMDEWVVPPLLVRLAWAQLDLGELSAAETTVAQAISRAQAMTYRVALIDALRVQAQVFTRQRRWDEAAQSLEQGVALARAMPYPYAEGRLLHVYGAMHSAKGAPEPARARLATALAIFRRLGARKDAEHVEHALAALPIP